MESKTAIIILNYNKYELTSRLLRNLKEIDYKGHIVVVDNNSKNNSFNILYNTFNSIEEKIHIIKSNQNRGYACGNNEGIRYIINKYKDIEYICISNPDVILDERFSMEENIKSIMNKEDIAGVAPIQILYGEQIYGWNLGSFKDIILTNISFSKILKRNKQDRLITAIDNIILTEVLPGSFFIIKKEVFEKINFFDEETFLYFEENILGNKVKQMGYKFAINLNQYYIHDHEDKDNEYKDIKYKIKDYKYYMQSQDYYVKKYISNKITYRIILFIVTRAHLYIEIPLINIVYKILKNKKEY